MKARVLVVEDEAVVAFDIEKGLRSLGYDITDMVTNGEDAMLSVEKQTPDLVLMDMVIRGEMDGIEVAAHIQDRYNIPIVYLTAHADENTLQKARVTAPFDFILKPFQEAELKPAIELALDRHQCEKLRCQIEKGTPIPKRCFGTDSVELGSIEQAFSEISPLANFPKELKFSLVRSSQIRSLSEGEFAFYENDLFQNTFLLLSGRIVLVKNSANGKELIVDLVPSRDVFLLSISLEEIYAPFSARAQIDIRMLQIPKKCLELAFKQLPNLYPYLIEHLARRLRDSFDLSRRLAHEKVEKRIAAAILGLRDRLGISSDLDQEFVLELTRKELADLAGTTPETASRISKMFEKEGILDLRQGGIVIVSKPPQLEALID